MPVDPGGLWLHLERVLPAPRSRVFGAMTEPRDLADWWGPRGFTAPGVEIDLRVGGRYRIAMQPPEGDVFHVSGEFHRVDPPACLAYTFRWEEPHPDDRETVVTLSMADRYGTTGLNVDQGPFASDERLLLHRGGWTESLDRLQGLLSR